MKILMLVFISLSLTGCLTASTGIKKETATWCEAQRVCESIERGQKIGSVEWHAGDPVSREAIGRVEVRRYMPCGTGYLEVGYVGGRVEWYRCSEYRR